MLIDCFVYLFYTSCIYTRTFLFSDNKTNVSHLWAIFAMTFIQRVFRWLLMDVHYEVEVHTGGLAE